MNRRWVAGAVMVCVCVFALTGLAYADGQHSNPGPQPGPASLIWGGGIHTDGGQHSNPGPQPGPDGMIWGGGGHALRSPASPAGLIWQNRVAPIWYAWLARLAR